LREDNFDAIENVHAIATKSSIATDGNDPTMPVKGICVELMTTGFLPKTL